ncbi:MAG: SusC/RagA family TonB-linked outer membrane protein [Rikenellaceae bacterium]
MLSDGNFGDLHADYMNDKSCKFMNKKLQVQNKFHLSMKLFMMALFVMLFSEQVQAASMLQKNVTINMQNASIKSILEEIQKQTGLSFVYNQKELSTLPTINVNVKNLSVQAVLDIIFKKSDFTYKIAENTISISKKLQRIQSTKRLLLKGKILDAGTGKSIEGATVLVLGTNDGAITGENGMFTLSLKPGAEIEISYVGMKPIKRTITESNDKFIMEMKADAMAVDEVVVTGYGDFKRSSFTGNSVVVKRDELLKVSKTNVIKALQAFDPSFRIKENNQWGSDPNALPEVYIRGESGIGSKLDLNSLDNNTVSKTKLLGNPNLPTFIMDGFEISVTQLYDMDPNRIESITILKDAAATALYGSRAANGVVVITTVAPKPGKLNVSYSFVADIVAPDLTDYNLTNAREKLDIEQRAGYYKYETESDKVLMLNEYNEKLRNVERGVDTYWLSKPLQTVFNHKHSMYVDGGNEHLRFGIDLQYAKIMPAMLATRPLKNSGVMKESGRDKFSAGFYLQYIYKNLQIKNYTSYNMTKANESKFGNFADYSKQLPYNEILDENGNYLRTLKFGDIDDKTLNPLYEANLSNYDKTKSDDLINNLSLNWNVAKGLLIKGQLSLTKSSSKSERFIDPLSIHNTDILGLSNISSGELFISGGDTFTLDMNSYASYSANIKKHNINAQAGINIKESTNTSVSSHYKGFPSGDLYSINYAQKLDGKPSSQESTTRLVGFLASLNYSYNNIYLLDASYRVDGSSSFGKDKRFAPFWSGGVGLNIHNYEFFKNINKINLLKVRATYGQTGKVNFPAYAASTYYEIITTQWYKTGFGSKLKAFGNDNKHSRCGFRGRIIQQQIVC